MPALPGLFVLALGVALTPVAVEARNATRSPAPAPNCLDARQVNEIRQPDPRTLAVALDDGGRFRVDMATECPGVMAASNASLLAREGWACGTGNEYVRADDRLCPIAGVGVIDAAGYAKLARASHTDARGTTTLDTVVVRGEQRRGFTGSSNYCLNPRHMRGWSEDPAGLVVEVDPLRAGGNRYYRVETAGSCPGLGTAGALHMKSGLGIGIICGNPGDRIVVSGDNVPGFYASGSDQLRAIGARLGCPIRTVYPIQVGGGRPGRP